MTDPDSASSSGDSEDVNTTGLIATRKKRSTAGNLYASLRANLDDEELQKELLAEDAEDVGDYEGSDKEGDDDEDVFESSSDDEDQGPPKEGEDEDLEGEKQLKKQERAELKKKRNAKAAKMKLPGGLGRATKRVRLSEAIKGVDNGETEAIAAPRSKKKSERSNWLPTAEDGPIRQSGRSLAVANREVVTANLMASAERSQHQQEIMKNAAERDRAEKLKHAKLTQEERLKKCERVERETAKELGRFEAEEAERQRAREEALAAKRRRGLVGPVFRVWSGSCVWEGEKIQAGRLEHGSLGRDEVMGIGKPKVLEAEDEIVTQDIDRTTVDTTAHAAQDKHRDSALRQDAPSSWLQGIEQYAAQSGTASVPGAPSPNAPAGRSGWLPSAVQPPQQISTYHHLSPEGPPAYFQQPQAPHAPAPVPLPIREQAQRTLLILEDFPELAVAPESNRTSKRKSLAASSTTLSNNTASSRPSDPSGTETLAPNPIQSLLLPDSYPPLTPTQASYLLSKPRKKGLEATLPPTPLKARCAMTQWDAKFRDPKTGVPYADLHAYKALQRALSGGSRWSGLLGAWVGASMGKGVGSGRPARGVPAGFLGGEGVLKKEAV